MLKNVVGQAIGSQVNTIDTGLPFSGEVKAYVTGDGGVQALGAVNGGLCVHEGNGYYTYRPTQGETNFDLIAFTFIGSGAIPSTAQVVTITEAQAAAISSSTITTIIGDGPTRTELLHQLAHRLNKTPPPDMDPVTETRLASYLNQRQRRLLTIPGLQRLRDATVTFTTVANQADYGLPNISKLSRLYETTNQRVLIEIGQQEYRLMGAIPMIGTPDAYIWTGRQVVAQQPPAPSSLFVKSSSPSDNTALVYIEGIASGGFRRTTSVALAGTTLVNIATTIASWTRIDKLYLSAICRGDIELLDGTSLSLALIPAGQLTSVYTGLTLTPTPSASIPYYADVTRTVSDLINGTDQAAIPEDFADVLVLGALADEYQHLSDARWSTAVTEYKEREHQLKYWLAETSMGRPFSLTRTWQRPSQLGSWFPAGS